MPYINPPNESKEEWLAREGERTSRDRLCTYLGDGWKNVPAGMLPVTLVDNGAFTAAGIAFKERELQCHVDPSDPRPMTYFLVETEKLYPVSDLEEYLPARSGKEESSAATGEGT